MFKSIITDTFDKCKLKYELLKLDGEHYIAVSQVGGHIFGPFSAKHPEGIFWAPEAIKDADQYAELIEKRTWNTGGDRIWIAPEIQFNIIDRDNYKETLKTPTDIDPGNFEIEKKGEKIYIAQNLSLISRNTVEGKIELKFESYIYKALNPLRELINYKELMEDVDYCGYEQSLYLECDSKEDVLAETWNLLQVRPEGVIYIDMYKPMPGTVYFAAPKDMERVKESGVCLKISGKDGFKTGYKSAVLSGRLAYLGKIDEEEYSLIIMNYPNNPSAMYSEEPPEIKGDRGYSVHIYSDDGGLGGFAEMECNLQTIGRPTGLDKAFDRVTKWIFTGKKERLQDIALNLIGYDMCE